MGRGEDIDDARQATAEAEEAIDLGALRGEVAHMENHLAATRAEMANYLEEPRFPKGVENSATRDENLKRLLRALSGLRCWPFDRPAAEAYGRIATELKRADRVIQQIDIQIAAIALSLGSTTVVSSDSDLASVPGLTVENWAV